MAKKESAAFSWLLEVAKTYPDHRIELYYSTGAHASTDAFNGVVTLKTSTDLKELADEAKKLTQLAKSVGFKFTEDTKIELTAKNANNKRFVLIPKDLTKIAKLVGYLHNSVKPFTPPVERWAKAMRDLDKPVQIPEKTAQYNGLYDYPLGYDLKPNSPEVGSNLLLYSHSRLVPTVSYDAVHTLEVFQVYTRQTLTGVTQFGDAELNRWADKEDLDCYTNAVWWIPLHDERRLSFDTIPARVYGIHLQSRNSAKHTKYAYCPPVCAMSKCFANPFLTTKENLMLDYLAEASDILRWRVGKKWFRLDMAATSIHAAVLCQVDGTDSITVHPCKLPTGYLNEHDHDLHPLVYYAQEGLWDVAVNCKLQGDLQRLEVLFLNVTHRYEVIKKAADLLQKNLPENARSLILGNVMLQCVGQQRVHPDYKWLMPSLFVEVEQNG